MIFNTNIWLPLTTKIGQAVRSALVSKRLTNSLALSLYAWPSTGRSALHAYRSVATLQASEGESPLLVVTCSTQHFRGPPGCLLKVPSCPEPCRDVTKRCTAWWAGAAWFIRLMWPKRECLLRLIASFMDGSCERVATSTFVTNSYQKMPSIRLWFVIWKNSSLFPIISFFICFRLLILRTVYSNGLTSICRLGHFK